MEKVIKPGETVISGYGSDVLFAGFAKKGQSSAFIADVINIEYRTTLWSNETSGNLINIDGVNIVYPFFDERVVDIAMSISPRLKFKDGWEKWILRKTFEDILPSEITWRRKIGIHQTTGIEAYLSGFINRNCQNSVKKIGLRLTKDLFTLEILKLLVLKGCQPSNIDFKTVCELVNHCGV
jgi:(carboxyethyl)arginine beta-lactam-synthase